MRCYLRMKRVTGIGGIFFKANDPDKLREWYRTHPGIEAEKERGAMFKWREVDELKTERYTVWSPFPADTDYFAPSTKPFMINFQVTNLKELLTQLRREGVAVDLRVETYDHGKFAWIMDPEGNRIELWEPSPDSK
jgi:predicted enzyme related to lactoylglutathione lyase